MVLFDHLIGGDQKVLRYAKAKRVGCLKVDHQFILGRCLHRQIGWLLTLEDAIDVTGSSAKLSEKISKRLADDKPFLKRNAVPSDSQSTNRFPFDFLGRHLALTWWGGHGIGANDWKEADYVFEFGEHFLPDRTMFATVQGLRGHKATMGMLWKTKSTNTTPDEVHLAIEGHLLRFMKQLGMRGRARKFDSTEWIEGCSAKIKRICSSGAGVTSNLGCAQ
jgi:hypothetical protein